MSSFHQLLEPLSLFTIAASILLASLLFKWFFKSSNKKLPPSPPKLPIIGNIHQIGKYPHRSLHDLAQQHGPLMMLHFGQVPVLVVSSADAAREILRTHDTVFASRPRSTPLAKIFYDCKDVAMAPYGEYWRQIKSICVLHLLNNKRIRSFHNVRAEEVTLVIEKIKQFASSSLPINLSDILCSLTNDVVCRIALGRKYSGVEGGSKFKKLFGEAGELMGTFHVGDYIPWLGWVCNLNGLNARLDKTAKAIDDILEGVVQEHEKRMSDQVEDHRDFVDVLLWVQKENVFGFPIDRVTIKAIIWNMFGAGTDTTFTVLEWTMTELLRHPKIMKEVQDEVRGIVGKKSDITDEDLDQMHYLKAVFKETLRFHPPVPLLLPRQSTQDVKINGYDIAAGTHVYINYGTIAKEPTSWDQADEFLPERFLNSSVNFLGHDLQLIPFGSGRRGCPGIEFAMRVNELALASLVNKFDWSLPCGDVDMTESTGTTAHKKSPLIALATPYSC